MTRLAAATVLCSAVFAPAARSDITYLSQERYISPLGLQVHAPDFAPWERDLYRVGSSAQGGFAQQASRLDPDGIRVSQYIRAEDGLNGSNGNAKSSLDVTFSLAVPSPVEIVGLWEIDANVSPGSVYNSFSATFEVFGSAPIFARSVSASYPSPHMPPFSIPFTYSGILDPGTYRLLAISYGVASAFSYGPDCEVRLTATVLIPAPASAIILGLPLCPLRRRRPGTTG